MQKTEQQLRGIGGWLIPFAICLVVLPINLLSAYAKAVHVFEFPAFQAHVSADPSWKALSFLETTAVAIAALLSIILIFLFFLKNPAFPAAYSLFVGLLIAKAIIHTYLVFSIPVTTQAFRNGILLRAVQTSLFWGAWCAYMLRSRRVRLTFTRRIDPPPDSALG